jgi:hypothetical protein
MTGLIWIIPTDPSLDFAFVLPFDSTQTIDEYNTSFITSPLFSGLIAINASAEITRRAIVTRFHLLVISTLSFFG